MNELVEVYRNLQRSCLSLRDPRTRRVCGYADRVLLLDAEFRVSESGRQRVLRERQKNVHAVVRGRMAARAARDTSKRWRRVRYNPFEMTTFVWARTGRPVKHAKAVYIGPEGCFAVA